MGPGVFPSFGSPPRSMTLLPAFSSFCPPCYELSFAPRLLVFFFSSVMPNIDLRTPNWIRLWSYHKCVVKSRFPLSYLIG